MYWTFLFDSSSSLLFAVRLSMGLGILPPGTVVSMSSSVVSTSILGQELDEDGNFQGKHTRWSVCIIARGLTGTRMGCSVHNQ